MLPPLAHLALHEICGSQAHIDHNARHQLGVIPTLLRDPGVFWAEHFVRSPDLEPVATGDDATLLATQYAHLALLRAPAAVSRRSYLDILDRAAPTSSIPANTPLQDFFVPLEGRVAPRLRISPEALPFRPARGIYLVLSVYNRRDAETEAAYRWVNHVRIPALLNCHGAAGAWSFAMAGLFRPDRDLSAPVLRAVLLWLDEDPADFVSDLAARDAVAKTERPDAEHVLFAAPYRNITAWDWNWFQTPTVG